MALVGDWLCLVYIQVTNFDLQPTTTSGDGAIGWESCKPWVPLDSIHVSLSRPFCLALWEIEPFKERLRQSIKGIAPFALRLDGEEPVVLRSSSTIGGDDAGDDLTLKHFLALKVTAGKAQVSHLVDQVDSVMDGFGKPRYFDERVLHASIAASASTDSAATVEVQFEDDHSQPVTSIVFKAGHHRFELPL